MFILWRIFIPGTIDISFFSFNTIDSLFSYPNLSIEEEGSNIQSINSNLNNNINNNIDDKNINNNNNFKDININRKRRIHDDEVSDDDSDDDSDTQILSLRKQKLSENINKNKKHKVFNITTLYPRTYDEALNGKDSEEWDFAFKK